MALIIKNTNDRPLGQFDGLDSQISTFKGGEVVTWGSVLETTWGGTDQAAADVQEDGYAYAKQRPVIQLAGSGSGGAAPNGPPLFLSDDGIAHYGTLFGAVVGGTVGQQSNSPFSYSGAVLGPSTALGSGKITCWAQAGLYGVTLDACDGTTGGLIPTNSNCTVGALLYYTSAGLLTMSANKVGSAANVGYLSEFQTVGSAVTTQQFMVAALNSPSGDVSSLQQETFYQAEFWFIGASA